MTTFGRLALKLIDDGYQPVPIQQDTKIPAVSAWQKKPNASVLSRWLKRRSDCGIGLVCGQIVAVDIDVLDHGAAQRLDDLTTALLGPTPLVRVGRPPKRLLVFRLAELMPTLRETMSVGKIEILAEGAQFVAFGRHPDTNQPYQWIGESSPEFTPVTQIPIVTPLQLENLLNQAFKLFPACQNSGDIARASKAGTAKRAGMSSIVRCPRTSKVLDGRDAHLAHLVFDAWRTHEHATAQQIAGVAWSAFEATADLTRPARDGKRSWRSQDALSKARHVLRKAKAGAIRRIARARGRVAPPGDKDLSNTECDAFRDRVLAAHINGRLNTNAWRTSEMMINALQGGQCVDSVWVLSEKLRVSPSTVNRARKDLLIADLWRTARQLGNRESTAPYFPNPELISKLLATQMLSQGGVASLTPNTIGGSKGTGSEGLAANDFDANAAPNESPLPEVPVQASDAIQFTCLPPACSVDELRLALSNWLSGPMPETVRRAYSDAKRRRAVREIDIARAVGISREHVANARFETFGLSPEAVARIKFWLLPDEFPIPPDLVPAGNRPTHPHHRRGGKKRPEPMPALPMLRLLRVFQGQKPRADLFQTPDRDARQSDQQRVSRQFG